MLDLLPAITNTKADIFIKKIETEALSWNAFLNPLSIELWITLISVAAIISYFLTTIERASCSLTNELWISGFMKNLWVAFTANFGGKPSCVQNNVTHRIVLFDCLLVGSIIWMAYRASFTSELSVIKLKLPFNNLESLLKSDYK